MFGVWGEVPPVQKGEKIPPSPRRRADTSWLRPATPVMLMGLELKMACPRATAARGDVLGSAAQASKGLKIAGVNLPSPAVTSPPGVSSVGTKGLTLEFMLIKKG